MFVMIHVLLVYWVLSSLKTSLPLLQMRYHAMAQVHICVITSVASQMVMHRRNQRHTVQ